MKVPVITLLLLTALACNEKKAKSPDAGSNDTNATAPKVEAAAPAPLDSAAKGEAIRNYTVPSEHHKFLASADGEWIEQMNFYQAPGAAPQTIEIKCVNKMILGGRFQESSHSGMIGGQPFSAVGTMGFDNARKVFISSWMDNLGTGIMFMEGTFDEATKTLNLKGKMTNHETGQLIDVRQEIKFEGPNRVTKALFMNREGVEFKYLDIVLTRKNPLQ